MPTTLLSESFAAANDGSLTASAGSGSGVIDYPAGYATYCAHLFVGDDASGVIAIYGTFAALGTGKGVTATWKQKFAATQNTTASWGSLWKLNVSGGTTDGVDVQVYRTSSSGKWKFRITDAAAGHWQSADTAYITVSSYVDVKVEVYLHATAGKARLTIGGEVVTATNVNTMADGDIAEARWYLSGGSATKNMESWADNILVTDELAADWLPAAGNPYYYYAMMRRNS